MMEEMISEKSQQQKSPLRSKPITQWCVIIWALFAIAFTHLRCGRDLLRFFEKVVDRF
jgi:hypothetical protein